MTSLVFIKRFVNVVLDFSKKKKSLLLHRCLLDKITEIREFILHMNIN